MKSANHKVCHHDDLPRLARVEGQVRGLGRMVEEGAYCVDIMTQIQAAQSALDAVGKRILRRHMDHCVTDALASQSREMAEEKIEELMKIMDRRLS
jgi:DNA-binding FrmR family transcriptional regulator